MTLIQLSSFFPKIERYVKSWTLYQLHFLLTERPKGRWFCKHFHCYQHSQRKLDLSSRHHFLDNNWQLMAISTQLSLYDYTIDDQWLVKVLGKSALKLRRSWAHKISHTDRCTDSITFKQTVLFLPLCWMQNT